MPENHGITLTGGQECAKKVIEDICEADPADRPYDTPYAVIGGYAGTGKSTLLKQIAHLHPLLLAPTGKAALRLREVTGRRASTIHRFCYSPREVAGGKVEFDPKQPDEPSVSCRLIVVDEASMINKSVWDDLLRAAASLIVPLPVVAVGDPFQLPPVEKPGLAPFSVFDLELPSHRSAQLTEVMRQAQGNPTIAASMKIRGGSSGMALRALPSVNHLKFIDEAMAVYRRGGVIICHSNRARANINNGLRQLIGFQPGTLEPGEPLLVMRNNYNMNSFNGEVVQVSDCGKPQSYVVDGLNVDIMTVRIAEPQRNAWVCLQEVRGELAKHPSVIRAIEKAFDKRQAHDSSPLPYLHAEYGYALTAHKSQGSEWAEVLVAVEPSVRLRSEEGLRWLYTAITRARETVRWCDGGPEFKSAKP